jgi:transcriptional regulator with XRE-family HTH domain
MNRALQLRLDNRCGIVDTADGAGISTKTLKKIEAGDTVSAEALGRLADFYGLTPSELLAPAVFGSTSGEAA